MNDSDLERLFSPDSIAIIGASNDPESLSGRPHRFLHKHGYPGDIFLINPNRESIDGHHCYDVVTHLSTTPDIALVLVPAQIASEVIPDCGRHGVSFAVVVASGFGESGHEGREGELLAAARDGDVRLLGPNSEGFLNISDGVAGHSPQSSNATT